MAAMSAAMAASGSAVAGPLSSPFSTSGFNSARVQQLGIKRTNTSLSASRIVVVRASHNSGEHVPVRSKILIALVAAGGALTLGSTPFPNSSGEAIALDLNSITDNVKELSSNIPSSNGDQDGNSAVEVAKQVAKRVATNAARDFASENSENKTDALLDSVKDLVGKIPSLGDIEQAKNAAVDVAKSAAQTVAADISKEGDSNQASGVFETVKSLSKNIPGFDADKMVQNAAIDAAKNATQSQASSAARDLADQAKNRIGAEAGKFLFNTITGQNNDNN
ncbi:uncharacterized protein [Physcomitrium patens]|uniref:Uncharacterized protein n=1 Tax=Physcomitrium patens TaxID=3218 RepID=A0A2K1JBQ1_PHYPA|nr:uncharacterized protein LOC112292205 [Physcomitrium patens]PNR38950.1 hypothetical protein PHYPA_019228 [Physcomitrium patens]|eukprot:XP_024396232.1 uncharacterized protein LOC112292205 [Physcomitrella patens]